MIVSVALQLAHGMAVVVAAVGRRWLRVVVVAIVVPAIVVAVVVRGLVGVVVVATVAVVVVTRPVALVSIVITTPLSLRFNLTLSG